MRPASLSAAPELPSGLSPLGIGLRESPGSHPACWVRCGASPAGAQRCPCLSWPPTRSLRSTCRLLPLAVWAVLLGGPVCQGFTVVTSLGRNLWSGIEADEGFSSGARLPGKLPPCFSSGALEQGQLLMHC